MHPVVTSLLLALSWWLAALGAVLASGAFPAAARPAALRGLPGMTATCALIAAVIALAGLSLAATSGHLPWPYLIIAAGLGSVLAPPCFVLLPAAMIDRPIGTAVLAACCVAGAAGWLLLSGLIEAPPAGAGLDALPVGDRAAAG